MGMMHIDAAAQPGASRLMWLRMAERFVRVAVWSIINAALMFAEHLAEMVAPLLLLAGGIWWLIPRALDAISLDGQPEEVLQLVRAHIPHEIYLDGSYYSAGTLITDALWLVAVVAICRTLSAALAYLLLEQR